MFKISNLINIKPIILRAWHFVDGFRLTRCMLLSGSRVLLELVAYGGFRRRRVHYASPHRDYNHTLLCAWCISTVWKLIDCTAPPAPPCYTQGESVCENRNECCSDWLSEIHLKLWMNCEVAISRLHRGSSICLSMADNVIHLPTSCFFCCSHTSLHVSMSVLTCYAPFLLKVLLSIPFILSLILWCMQRATCDP